MGLAGRHGQEYGLNRVLAALGLSKGTWHYRRHGSQRYTQKYASLKGPLLAIAREHPSYGYRKVTTELREKGWQVNHKVVQRLQRAWDLPLVRSRRPPTVSAIRRALREMGSRVNLVLHLEQIGILEVLYTDFTEILYAGGHRKAHLMPLVDHTSKLAVGWAVGESADTALALKAYRRARRTLQRLGLRLEGIIVHHDQDPVYTSHAWVQTLRVRDGIRLSYSLEGARENTHIESFIGHFKGENASLFWEQEDLKVLERIVDRRMHYYNRHRRHASLGNRPPMAFLMDNGFGEPARC